MEISPLQNERINHQVQQPEIFKNAIASLEMKKGEIASAGSDSEGIKDIFPNSYGRPVVSFVKGNNEQKFPKIRVGVILSGGQAPGGHNVIAGLFDALKKGNPESELYGFARGPAGLINDNTVTITQEMVDDCRNTGGFDMIGSGRDKIETQEHYEAALAVCKKREINAVVIIGGDDSNTNAALLAEYFLSQGTPIAVVGCPKTIDGDLKNDYIETSFGFDTAAKTYAELIGNIERDALSAKKYWHFIRLMGRSASHITLECALKNHPNITLISEEVREKQISLDTLIGQITEVIKERSANGKNYGIALLPEGVVEFIPGFDTMIQMINDILAGDGGDTIANMNDGEEKFNAMTEKLGGETGKLFASLPASIQGQLLADRDPHGNVQVSKIETEKMFIGMVEKRLAAEAPDIKFSSLSHFFGYEGRCAFPSNFDANYCYALGYTAFLLIANDLSGYMACVRNLEESAKEWSPGGIPMTMMMNLEQRKGKKKPVIEKALVKLNGKPFETLAANRDRWAKNDDYEIPGPIQYYGPDKVCNLPSLSLLLEKGKEI